MAQRDLYEVLELPRGASAAEIKKAYKRLARKLHSDLNPGTRRRGAFQLRSTKPIRSSPIRRRRSNTIPYGNRRSRFHPRPGVHFDGFDFGAGPSSAGGFEDLFETFTHAAQRPQPRGPLHGEDLILPHYSLAGRSLHGKEIPAGHHAYRTLRPVPRRRAHEFRLGRSPAPGALARDGWASREAPSFQSTCDLCGGTGRDPGEVCTELRRTGTKESSDTVDATIPAGVDTDPVSASRGKGQAGRMGDPQGDLYNETHILPSPVFLREGPTLKVRACQSRFPRPYSARVDVPTLGRCALEDPPATSSGQTFRLKGRGMPSCAEPSPATSVEVTVAVPAIVDEKSKDLLREFER